MTNEEAKHIVDVAFGVPQAVRRIGEDRTYHEDEIREAKKKAIKALESCRDIEEIREVMSCDADAETKCKMISNILTAKPHYFKEQEPILDKIRAEIEELSSYVARFNGGDFAIHIDKEKVLQIIDKYRGES